MKYIKLYTLILLICFVVLGIFYNLYINGYKRFYSFEHERLNEIINGKINYNILFLGSSRTYYHINPRIVDSVTNLNSFNAGSSGATLLEMNLYLQCYLKSHRPPKLVIADIAKNAFEIKKRTFFNPNFYYPFLKNEVVFNTLREYEQVTLLKYLPFTRFVMANDIMKENAFLGYFGYKSVEKSSTYKGYQARENDTISLPFKRFYPVEVDIIETRGIELLNEIIRTCKKNAISLILTYAPTYRLTDKTNPVFFSLIEDVSVQNKIPFLNFRTNNINNQHRLFRDEIHLNRDGADIYSKVIAAEINSSIQK